MEGKKVSAKRVSIPIDADVYDELEKMAENEGVTLQEYVDKSVISQLRELIKRVEGTRLPEA